MEARTELRGTGISKLFVGAFLVIVAVGLGVMAAVVAKNLSAPAAAPSHFVQGQGGAAQAAYRGGAQVVDGNAATAPKAVGPDDRAGAQLAPAYHQVDTRGVTGGISSSLQVDTRGIIPNEAFGLVAGNTQLGSQSFLGPDAQERNLQLAAGMRTAEPHGYI